MNDFWTITLYLLGFVVFIGLIILAIFYGSGTTECVPDYLGSCS